MIDLRYHIASIVAVFLALGLGILIGSTIVGDDLLVDQQKKVIDRLELQFEELRTREAELTTDSEYKSNIINKYENYSQAVQPLLIQGHLKDYKVALVVCGDSDVPAGLQNTLSMAGAQVVSKTVVLANMKLDNTKQRAALADYYNLDTKTSPDTLRRYIAGSVGNVITGKAQPDVISYLQSNELVRLTGDTSIPVNGVIV
ncbi:MAG: copper transporter, partial [Deltaproteobacteria bacterium]